jgi:hypothetical protein
MLSLWLFIVCFSWFCFVSLERKDEGGSSRLIRISSLTLMWASIISMFETSHSLLSMVWLKVVNSLLTIALNQIYFLDTLRGQNITYKGSFFPAFRNTIFSVGLTWETIQHIKP